MIDTQAIRIKILDLAIHGMLTDQLPEDGTADELYREIQEEKQGLIKAGKIKKEKPLSDITDDEIPFEIPENWMWVRLGEYCQKVTDQVASGSFATLRENVRSLKTPDYAIMVKTADFANGFTTNLTYTDKHGYEFLSNSNLFGGELILSNVGSVGKCFIVPKLQKKMTLAPNAVMIRMMKEEGKEYLYYFLISSQGNRELNAISTGVAVKKFNKTELKKILIPLPPIAEQQRIVDRIEQSFSVLEKINSLQVQYAENKKALRAKLINAALQGKLTEQLSEDGSAEELYQQIQAEKQTLIKNGKIKKEKSLPSIVMDDPPFDIPANWKWVSVGEVCANIQYGSSEKSSPSGKMIVLRMGNIQNGKIVYDKLAYTSDEDVIAKYPLEINDLLFNRTNSIELVGKTAIYKGEFPATYAGYLVRITPVLLMADYLNYAMQSQHYWEYCKLVRSDSIGQSNINAEKLKRFVFPLPPLAEQQRIVSMLEVVCREIDS